MAWYSKIRSLFGQQPVHEAAGRGRRSLAWMPGNPGAVAAMLATNAELRGKSRDLVRRNAWAQAGIEAFVANALGCPDRPLSDGAQLEKFIDCLSRAAEPVGRERAEALAERILALEACEDVGTLF